MAKDLRADLDEFLLESASAFPSVHRVFSGEREPHVSAIDF